MWDGREPLQPRAIATGEGKSRRRWQEPQERARAAGEGKTTIYEL